MKSSQSVAGRGVAALAAAALFALAAGVGGCAGSGAGGGVNGKSKAEPMLQAGVQQYEDGNYPDAGRNLQGALDAGLAQKSDQVRAHKYLAFIACVSEREKQCRSEFLIALQLDSGFELKPSESGHPIWGPIFRSIKAGK
jgi:Tfp pilus assembly protein PilF